VALFAFFVIMVIIWELPKYFITHNATSFALRLKDDNTRLKFQSKRRKSGIQLFPVDSFLIIIKKYHIKTQKISLYYQQ